MKIFVKKVLVGPVNSARDPLTENMKSWKRVKRSIQTDTKYTFGLTFSANLCICISLWVHGYYPRTHKSQQNTVFSFSLGPTVLFTHLKIILL